MLNFLGVSQNILCLSELFYSDLLMDSRRNFAILCKRSARDFAILCMSQNLLSQTDLSEFEPRSLAIVIHTSQDCIFQAIDAVIS